MQQKVFITAAGKHLPGKPVTNDEIEQRLGLIYGKPSRMKEKMLKQNGIQTRYYAIDEAQRSTTSNSAMTAAAITDCIGKSAVYKKDIDYIAAATTQGDLPVPGFASMVHAATGIDACEIATLHGVCGSS